MHTTVRVACRQQMSGLAATWTHRHYNTTGGSVITGSLKGPQADMSDGQNPEGQVDVTRPSRRHTLSQVQLMIK